MNRLLIFGLVCVNLCPVALMAQKKEDLQSIQRDVAQLQEQVKELQRSQDDKLGSLQSSLQAAVDSSAKVTAALAAFERQMESKLSDQQSQVVAPLSTKIDQMSDDVRSVSTNVQDLVRRLSALDSKVTDISNAVRTLAAQTPAPAPPGSPAGSAPGAAPAAGPPANAPSADTLWENARRDYSGGKFDLALQEYSDYLRYYPDTDNAPGAAYYIGYIYYNAQQYDDAVKAFDKVLSMPENPKSADSMYYRAVSLMKSDHRTEAGTAFRDFIRKYPHNEHVSMAHANLRNLGLEARSKKHE